MKVKIKIKYSCGCEEEKIVEMSPWSAEPDAIPSAEIDLDDCGVCAYEEGLSKDTSEINSGGCY